jgi:hypothetical protein
MGGRQQMRSVLVILTICGLILLAFSPVWYDAMAGKNHVILAPQEAKAQHRQDADS